MEHAGLLVLQGSLAGGKACSFKLPPDTLNAFQWPSQTNNSTQNTTMDQNIVTGFFTLAGVVIGVIATSRIAARAAHLENQRHIRQIGLQMALISFDFFAKQAQVLADKNKIPIPIKPLEVFVAEGVKMAEIFANPNLNGYTIGQRLAELEIFTKNIQAGMDSVPHKKVNNPRSKLRGISESKGHLPFV
jgi:hypothetical protein